MFCQEHIHSLIWHVTNFICIGILGRMCSVSVYVVFMEVRTFSRRCEKQGNGVEQAGRDSCSRKNWWGVINYHEKQFLVIRGTKGLSSNSCSLGLMCYFSLGLWFSPWITMGVLINNSHSKQQVREHKTKNF